MLQTIKISLTAENGRAVLSVRDYGNGIPENELANIWDKYYTTRMRKGKGVSGLGLAIVKQTAEIHNGNCHVDSEQGKGSNFVSNRQPNQGNRMKKSPKFVKNNT